jgi:hypothetical protein
MQTITLQTCSNCNNLQDLLEKIDLKLWELSQARLQRLQYNLDTPKQEDRISNLLHYKRIVTKRLYNGSYPCAKYSTQDLLTLVLPEVYTTKKCLCLEEPPSQ